MENFRRGEFRIDPLPLGSTHWRVPYYPVPCCDAHSRACTITLRWITSSSPDCGLHQVQALEDGRQLLILLCPGSEGVDRPVQSLFEPLGGEAAFQAAHIGLQGPQHRTPVPEDEPEQRHDEQSEDGTEADEQIVQPLELAVHVRAE